MQNGRTQDTLSIVCWKGGVRWMFAEVAKTMSAKSKGFVGK